MAQSNGSLFLLLTTPELLPTFNTTSQPFNNRLDSTPMNFSPPRHDAVWPLRARPTMTAIVKECHLNLTKIAFSGLFLVFHTIFHVFRVSTQPFPWTTLWTIRNRRSVGLAPTILFSCRVRSKIIDQIPVVASCCLVTCSFNYARWRNVHGIKLLLLFLSYELTGFGGLDKCLWSQTISRLWGALVSLLLSAWFRDCSYSHISSVWIGQRCPNLANNNYATHIPCNVLLLTYWTFLHFESYQSV